ncbi:MAG: hypothetical protein GY938_02720 [Ketobacter sp.]|nr:hypothetical protein [Ketobacter sp.]
MASLLNITDIKPDRDIAPFSDPFKFEITVEVYENLNEGLGI